MTGRSEFWVLTMHLPDRVMHLPEAIQGLLNKPLAKRLLLTASPDLSVLAEQLLTVKHHAQDLTRDQAKVLIAGDARHFAVGDHVEMQVWDGAVGRPITPPLKKPAPAKSPATKHQLPIKLDSDADDRYFRFNLFDHINNFVVGGWGKNIPTRGRTPEEYSVGVWEAGNGARVGEISTLDSILDLDVSGDCDRVVVGSLDTTAKVWTRSLNKSITLNHAGAVQSVSLSTDGKYVATGSNDMTARVWNSESGSPVSLTLQHAHSVSCVMLTPKGDYLTTVTSEGQVMVWNSFTGRELSPPYSQSQVRMAYYDPETNQLRAITANELISWSFKPLDFAVPQLRAQAQLLSGRRLEGGQGIVLLEGGESNEGNEIAQSDYLNRAKGHKRLESLWTQLKYDGPPCESR